MTSLAEPHMARIRALSDQRESFRKEAIDAWNNYQATGLHVTDAEADAWLAELEAGNDIEPPPCYKTGQITNSQHHSGESSKTRWIG